MSGCSSFYEEETPPDTTTQVMYAPELSHGRECRMTGDPPPPIREEIQKTTYVLVTQAASTTADVTPVTTATTPTPTAPAETPQPLKQ